MEHSHYPPTAIGLRSAINIDLTNLGMTVWRGLRRTRTVLTIAAMAPLLLAATRGSAWDTPVAISAAGQDASSPIIALDKKGNAIATWQLNPGGGISLVGSFRPKGGTFGPETQFTSAGASGQIHGGNIAIDAKGNALTIWAQKIGAKWGLEVSSRPKDGNFGTPTQLSPVDGVSYYGQVAFDKKGNALAMWSAYFDGQYHVQASTRPKDGAFAAPTLVSLPDDEGGDPSFAFDKKGNALAVWANYTDATGHIAAAFRPKGGGFGAPVTISAESPDIEAPLVAFDAKGNAIAAWTRHDGANYRAEAAFRSKDGTFGTPITLSAAGKDAIFPSVAFDKKGNAVAVWHESDGTSVWVEAAIRPKDGSFGSPVAISAEAEDDAYPQVVFDKKGNGLVYWGLYHGDPYPYLSVIQAASLPKGSSTFSTPVTISEAGYGPQIVFDSKGNAIALWQGYDGTNFRIESSFNPKP